MHRGEVLSYPNPTVQVLPLIAISQSRVVESALLSFLLFQLQPGMHCLD